MLPRLTNLVLGALLLAAPAWAQAQSQDVPTDPPIQRPQPIPQSDNPRVVPVQPAHPPMPQPTNLPPPPTYVAPAMIPQGLLPPGVQPGSTMPVPTQSPYQYGIG